MYIAGWAMAVLLGLLLLTAPGKAAYVEDVKFAVAELEKECGHFFEAKGIAWGKVRAQFLKEAKGVRSHPEHLLLLVRLVARLRDGHAAVLPTDATKDVRLPEEPPWKGPGMFWVPFGPKVLVQNVWEPAAGAGITAGMEVVKVDDLPVRKWLERRVLELRDRTGFSTEQQGVFFACHWGLAGPEGSRLQLELRAPDGKTKKATLTRGSGSYVPDGPAFPPPGLKAIGRQRYGRTQQGCGYVHLRDTPDDLPAQLDTMLAEIGDVKGLVLDCRANGGGGCDHDAVFGRFVPAGKTHGGYASQGPAPYAGPMVVIVDAGVRSAGETVSGMFKEDGRAYMIGPSPTAGMSSQKETIDLPSGLFRLYVSVHSNKKRFNHGKGIEGIGVPPHEIVPYHAEDLAAGVDTLIRRAEELLADFPRNKVPYKAP